MKKPAAIAALVVLGLGQPARAQVTEVVVVPTGGEEALVPTTEVAAALVEQLNAARGERAHLAYPVPPLPPRDAKKVRNADLLLQKARKAYKTLANDRAKKTLAEALELYKDLVKSGLPPDGYIETLHQMAGIALGEEKYKAANKHMNDAIVFGGGLPAKQRHERPVLRLYEGLMAEGPGQGTVSLKVEPPGLLWLNGRLQGLARGKVTKRAGLYLVRVYRPGHLVWQKWFRVQPHQERELAVTLNRDSSPEPPELAELRDEVKSAGPGPALQRFSLEQTAPQVMLVAASPGCGELGCKVALAWARDGKWFRRKVYRYRGKPEAVARAFLGTAAAAVAKKPARPPAPAAATAAAAIALTQCTMDSQCGFKEECLEGRCQRVAPITRKWWFWTLVGAAVVGATVGIAVPLAQSDQPVIEVR